MSITIPAITIPAIIWLPAAYAIALFALYFIAIGICYKLGVNLDKWFP